MQEDSSAEGEAVDDPSLVNPGQEDKSDADDTSEDDTFPDPEITTKKKRVRNKNKPAKLTKCPHCFREFTNLKHHINQQHSQVRIGDIIIIGHHDNPLLIFSVEELQVRGVWLQLLSQDRPRASHLQREDIEITFQKLTQMAK